MLHQETLQIAQRRGARGRLVDNDLGNRPDDTDELPLGSRNGLRIQSVGSRWLDGMRLRSISAPELCDALIDRAVKTFGRVNHVHARNAKRQTAFLDEDGQDGFAVFDRVADFVGNIVRCDRARRDNHD